MKNEISSTVKKLKESAGYYENVLNGIEEGYEIEIESNEQTKARKDAKDRAIDMELNKDKAKTDHDKKTIDHDEIYKLTKDSSDKLVSEKKFLNEITERIRNT